MIQGAKRSSTRELKRRRRFLSLAVMVGAKVAGERAGVTHSTIFHWAYALGMTLPKRGMDGTMKHRPPKRCGKCGKR